MFLYTAAVCTGTRQAHSTPALKWVHPGTVQYFVHTCDSVTGVGGEKVENASFKICRHPCEELTGLITEIHDLRIVTNNLLEDLDRVVRNNARVLSACWLLYVVFFSFKMKKETEHF